MLDYVTSKGSFLALKNITTAMLEGVVFTALSGLDAPGTTCVAILQTGSLV